MDEIKNLEDENVLKLSLREPAYFSVLIDRYQDSFLKTAFGVVRSRQEAEDIVQETFAKIYLNGSRFKKQPDAKFKSWAYKILMNTSFTHYQKLKKVGGKTEYLDTFLYDDNGPMAETSNLSDVSDAKAQVSEVIGKMPEHLGRLLKLYYLEDMSYQDIAEAEKISMSTLKMRLFRAKRIFKRLSNA
ncbi:MAG TPA: RNA polymerase sigma factor [Candidatus Paceibacterota bacterium]